jgi:hypothetical protein
MRELPLQRLISGCYHPAMPQEGKVDLSDLYPGLDPEQLDHARQNFESYLGVIFRINERQAKDVPPEPVADPVKVS